MDLDNSRALVVGATGVLGSALSERLAEEGARLVLTGRDPDKLAQRADRSEHTVQLDLLDVDACRDAVASAAEVLGGLDLLVIATGVAGFGSAADTTDAVAEELFAVNTLAPMALISAAIPVMEEGGSIVVLSAILADAPMAGMAAYSASKAALSAYLTAVRREVKRQDIRVLDVRPPHMETGLADRAIAGEPPKLPEGFPVDDLVATLLDGIRDDSRQLAWDAKEKRLRLS